MSVDLTKVIYYSGANSFKNTGVYDTSITFSGSITAGATQTQSVTITLNENQAFAYAIAEYADLQRVIFGTTTKYWQKMTPYAGAYVRTTPTGNLGAFLSSKVNGSQVTFTGLLSNPYGVTETITTTVINIRYVTYTVTS